MPLFLDLSIALNNRQNSTVLTLFFLIKEEASILVPQAGRDQQWTERCKTLPGSRLCSFSQYFRRCEKCLNRILSRYRGLDISSHHVRDLRRDRDGSPSLYPVELQAQLIACVLPILLESSIQGKIEDPRKFNRIGDVRIYGTSPGDLQRASASDCDIVCE
jgi:hypothetical protein